MTKEEAINIAINALGEQPRPIDPTVEVDLASGSVPRSALNRVTNPPKVTIHVDRPKGHWIWSPVADDGTVSGCCDQCSFSHMFVGGHTAQYNFCPNCGADMRGRW